MADLRYGVRLTADGSVLVSEAGKAEQAIKKIGAEAEKSSVAASKFGAALGAFAAAGAIALGALVKQTISTAAALDDLSESTGSSVEALSALGNSMAVSGVDFGTFQVLTNKLAVALSGVDDEGGKAAKALAALGVKSKDPAVAMKELALALDKYADGANKAALMTDIFGRGAAQYTGAMKDLARDSEQAATITTNFAAEAEALQKELAKARIEVEALAVSISGPLVSAFTSLLQMGRTAGVAGIFAWAGITPEDQQNVRAELDKTDAKIRTLKETIAALSSDSVAAKINRLLSPEDLAAANAQLATMQARYAELLRLSNASFSSDSRVDRPDAPSGPSGSTTKVKKAADTWNEFAAAIKRVHDNAENWAKTELEIIKQQETLNKAIADGNTSMAVYVDKQSEAVRTYDEQTTAIGKTAEELNALELARQAEIRDMRLLAGWGEDAIRIYDEWAAAIGRRNQALSGEEAKASEKRFVEDWKRSAQQIGDGLTDALLNAAESGRDFFKSLARDLYSMFSNLVLRPIIQGVMAPIAGGAASMLYGGGAGAQGMGGNGPGSLAQNYAGGYIKDQLVGYGTNAYTSAVGSGMFGSAAAAYVSPYAATAAYGGAAAEIMGGAGGLAAGGAVMEGMAALAAAAPYIAAVVAVAYALYEAFGQEPGGPKLGGYAASGAITPWDRAEHFTPNQLDASLQPVVDAWVKGVGESVAALGGTAGAYGYDLGIDKDPNGQAANRLGIRASVGGKQVYNYWSGDDALGRDDATLQSAIELESKRALVAALRASDLPASIAAVFNTVAPESMSSGAVDNLMAFASAMKAAIDSVSGDVLADATTAWESAQDSSIDRLRTMGEEVVRLSGAMDGSTASMQELASASQTYRQAVAQVLIAIRQVAQQAQQMQGSLVQSIQNWGMTPGQSFNYWTGIANQQALGLATATSPEQVNAIATSTYGAISEAFNALPEDLKEQYRPALLEFLGEFGEGVSQALTNIQSQTIGDTANPFAAVNTALGNAATKFDGAATTQASAATKIDIAADKLTGAVDKFVGALPIQVEAVVVDHLV